MAPELMEHRRHSYRSSSAYRQQGCKADITYLFEYVAAVACYVAVVVAYVDYVAEDFAVVGGVVVVVADVAFAT